MDQDPVTQPIESSLFNEWEINFPIFAQERAQVLEGVSGQKEP